MISGHEEVEPDVAPSGSVLPASCWNMLRFDQQLTTHNYRYELQVLTFCRRKHAGLSRDHGHAWIRLIKPDGSYSSLGFYPDESMGVEPEKLPGLRFPGVLLQPDKYDDVKKNVLQTCIPISELRFKSLTHLLELKQEQAMTDGLCFDLVEENCVKFVETSCRSVSVEVDSQCRFLSFFRGYSFFRYIVPAPVGAWFFNVALLFLGGLSHKPQRYLCRAEGKIELCVQVNITPLFSSVYRGLLRPRNSFYHVKGLQAWQRKFDGRFD